MSDSKTYDVFLSHNSQDKKAVEELARRLVDEAHLKPWLDKWNLVPGAPWQEALEQALDASRVCAVFIGHGGISPWQNEEMRAALEERAAESWFRVIPVLLPSAHLPSRKSLPRFLSRLTWVDFRGPRGLADEAAFSRLVAGIRGVEPGPGTGGVKGLLGGEGELPQLRRKALWIILTAFFATASVTLLADIVQRFLSGGGDLLGTVRTVIKTPLLVVQGALALLAGGALTEPGREWVEKLLSQAGLFRNYGVKKRLLISALVCLLVVSARLSLPYAAVYFNERAARALAADDETRAIYNYQRAVSLNPDYAQAHYGLGSTFERFQKYDEAIDEYARAVTLDPDFTYARNNLARLYLRRGREKDFENALQLIDDELRRSPSDQKVLYSLYKNRGWANYELKHLRQAENDLRRAVSHREDGAAAHCLLGYVLEAAGNPAASEEWEYCVAYAPGQRDVEAKWLGDAKERLLR